MQELKVSTEIKVRIGPFVDVSDGFTPQTDITLGGDTAEALKHNGAATVDISGATWAAVTGAAGWYDLTLTTALTDTLGQLTIVVQDNSDCLPVSCHFMVTTANYWNSKYSTDKFDCNVAEVTAGIIANASFNADVGTTAHGTNVIALAVRKILEELNLDHLLKVTTTVAADDDLESYVVAGTVMAHIMSAAADATAFKASTDSLEAIKVFADTIKAETALIVGDTDVIDDATSGLVKIASDVAAILVDTGTDGVVLKAAGLNADAVAEIWSAAMTDMAAGAPSATATALVALNWIYEAWRNKTTTTATEISIFKDDASTVLAESTISDDGSVFTKGEIRAAN